MTLKINVYIYEIGVNSGFDTNLTFLVVLAQCVKYFAISNFNVFSDTYKHDVLNKLQFRISMRLVV